MSNDLDDLARAAADALVSAMVSDSWEVVKRRFAALVGHERRMNATHAELAAVSGPARYRACLEQARAWSTRLRDALEDDPAKARGLRGLVAELGVRPAEGIPTYQHAQVQHGSQAVNVGGSISRINGEVYVGVGKMDKRKTSIALTPFGFLTYVTRKVVTAHPAVTVAVVVVAASGIGGWRAHWPAAVFGARVPKAAVHSAVLTKPSALPPVAIYAIGEHKVTPVNAATQAVGRGLPIADDSGEVWRQGSSQVAVAQTRRGLTAYVLDDGTRVFPVHAATDTAGPPIPLGLPYGGVALAADPNGQVIYVIITRGNSTPGLVIPIETATDKVGKAIVVGVQPVAVAFSPAGKLAYVANAADNTVTPITVATGAAGTPIPAAQDVNTMGMVFTPDGRTAYIPGPQITAINVASGTVAATIPVSAARLAISPDGGTLYALGNQGSTSSLVTPINTAGNTAGTPIPVNVPLIGEILARPSGKTVYLLSQLGVLIPIDVTTGTVGTAVTDPGGYADDMTITPDGKTIWIADDQDGEIDPFNTATSTMGKPVKIADDPYLVAIVP